MSINTIFSFLVPKEDKFFPLINKIGDILQNAADLQVDFFQNKDVAKQTELYHKIKAQETESDKYLDLIFKELNESFITPFDREDIHELGETVDDMVDGINSCTKRVLLFRPKNIPEDVVKMSKIVQNCAVSVNVALHELTTLKKNPEVALKQCSLLHDLESEADELYENFIKNLFDTPPESVELIKLKEIMQELERTTDISKSVGKIVKTIIVKYS